MDISEELYEDWLVKHTLFSVVTSTATVDDLYSVIIREIHMKSICYKIFTLGYRLFSSRHQSGA